MLTEDGIRQGFVTRALAVEGLNASPARLADYLALLACSPRETAPMRTAMATMSSCALAVRGLWARAGVDDPILTYPYVIEHAVSDVFAIASKAGALRPRSYAPLEGDVVILDAPVHVLTVVARDVAMVASIDGGQMIGGYEGILRRARSLLGTTLGGRPILHVVDCLALAQHYLAGGA